jgi:hypothetical protein
VVRQGDTVASIVLPMGGDPDTVWKDAKNDDLRKLRSDPAVLCAGDILYVPDDDPPSHSVQAGDSKTFTSPTATQTVKVVLMGEDPIANAAYVIHGIGDADIQGTTGGDGSLSVDVPVDVDSFMLELTDQRVTYQVLVGHLDPITEDSGVQQRLANLGYRSAIADIAVEAGMDFSDSHQRLLLCALQRDAGLPVTGELDAATLDALRKAHGA